MGDKHTWLIIIVVVLVTAFLRFLPFLVFNGKLKTPKIIEKLSDIVELLEEINV